MNRSWPKSNLRSYDWVFLSLILLFVMLVRWRLLGFPFERDEGEYAYVGQLILQGIPPYSMAYNMKFPGTYFMYALIMGLLGQTITAVHVGLMIINCATILLVYRIGAKIVSSAAGIVAACSYALLSLNSSVLGFAGHATHFVVFWAMGGLLVLLYATERNRPYLLLLSGVLFALGFIMKQPGIFFPLFGAVYILTQSHGSQKLSLKRLVFNLGVFACGNFLPLVAMIAYVAAAGVFKKFLFFTFVYSSKYASQIPLSGALDVFLRNFGGVIDGFGLLWAFSGLGLICLLFHPGLRNNRLSLSLFAFCSFLTVCPTFFFRRHYFITLLPAVSLFVGIFIDYVYVGLTKAFKVNSSPPGKARLKSVAVGVFLVAILIGLVRQNWYFFKEKPMDLCRAIYEANPFPESIEVAEFIRRNSTVADRIAVLGSEPQIYFYAQRQSATGYIYTYSLMERHEYALEMQQEMVREIERSRPKFIVVVRTDASWLIRPDSERFILRWADDYVISHYYLVGIADVISAEKTVYKWYEEARDYTPQSAASVLIFQRLSRPSHLDSRPL